MNTRHIGTEVQKRELGHRTIQLAPDNVGLEQREPTFLWGIANKAKCSKRHRFREIYRCLNEELIYHAWESLNK